MTVWNRSPGKADGLVAAGAKVRRRQLQASFRLSCRLAPPNALMRYRCAAGSFVSQCQLGLAGPYAHRPTRLSTTPMC